MSLLTMLFRHSRGMVILASLAAVVAGASNAALLRLLQLGIEAAGSASKVVLWGFFGVCVAAPLLRITSEIILIHLGQNTVFKLRLDLGRQVLALPLSRLEEIGPHRILSTLTEDVPRITNSVTILPILCFNIAILISCFVYLVWLAPLVFLFTLGFLVLGILSYQLPVIRANRYFHAARSTADKLYKHFEALTKGLKELKLHRRRRRAFLEESLYGDAERYRGENISGMRIYAIASSWGQFMIFLILGLLVFVLPTLTPVAAETMVGYTIVFLFMVTPLQMTMNTLPELARANVALRRIESLGLELVEGRRESIALEAPKGDAPWQSLELVEATHVYPRSGEEQDFVLGPLTLTFQPGELVFITGGNGSGKTTFAKLLTGLYEPDSGEIRVNGRAITGEDLERHRALFSVVFSDFFLFDELLGLASDDLDLKARGYLERLKLTEKVRVEDGRLSTTRLSQGQRKRLALLTAYLEDRPIYLFDEWAADQDPSFKAFFYHALLPELRARGKTVLVISHDDAYYHLADRLLKLENGNLVRDLREDLHELEMSVAGAGASAS